MTTPEKENPFRQMRLDRGLKQNFVAKAIDVSPVFLSQFETNDKDFSTGNLKKIIAFYRTTTNKGLTSSEKKAIVKFLLGEEADELFKQKD